MSQQWNTVSIFDSVIQRHHYYEAQITGSLQIAVWKRCAKNNASRNVPVPIVCSQCYLELLYIVIRAVKRFKCFLIWMLLSTWKSVSAFFVQMLFYWTLPYTVVFNFTLTFSLGAVILTWSKNNLSHNVTPSINISVKKNNPLLVARLPDSTNSSTFVWSHLCWNAPGHSLNQWPRPHASAPCTRTISALQHAHQNSAPHTPTHNSCLPESQRKHLGSS